MIQEIPPDDCVVDMTTPDGFLPVSPKRLPSDAAMIIQHRTTHREQDLRTIIANLKFNNKGKKVAVRTSPPQEIISRFNTTIIGDFSLATFANDDKLWQVQCFHNANVKTLHNRVISGEVVINH